MIIVRTDEIVYYDNEFACIFGQKSDSSTVFHIFKNLYNEFELTTVRYPQRGIHIWLNKIYK